jgi:phosphonate transport system substrate-binding protein
MGLFAAGGGIQSTLDNHPVVTTNNLRVLMRTSYFTPHAFAAHKRISPAVVTKVRTSLLAMHRTPEGRALLEELGFSPLVIASDNDYDDIRVLDLNLLRHLTSSP